MKIDLKESLNELDIISDNKYDLYNIYLSKNPSIGTKKKLAEAIYKNKTPKEISLILKEGWDDAAWHDTADQEQVDQPDYFPDGDEESEWKEMDSKSVRDSDGFLTDYTWYWRNNNGEDQHVFVFGDSDLYGPEDGYFDWECDSLEEAQEWFENYTGPGDGENDWMDESLKEDFTENDLVKGKKFVNKNGVEITIVEPTKDGKVQFIVKGKSFSPDCGGGSKKGIFNMLKKNGYSLKESFPAHVYRINLRSVIQELWERGDALGEEDFIEVFDPHDVVKLFNGEEACNRVEFIGPDDKKIRVNFKTNGGYVEYQILGEDWKKASSIDEIWDAVLSRVGNSINESVEDTHSDFETGRKYWNKLNLDIDFDSALDKWNKSSELAEPDTWYAKPLYSEEAWNDMVSMFSSMDESLDEDYTWDLYNKDRDALSKEFKSIPSKSDYRYKFALKKEKELAKKKAELTAKDKGSELISPSFVTRLIKKELGYTKYKTATTSVRGYNKVLDGQYDTDVDVLNNNMVIYCKDRKVYEDIVKLLKDNGVEVRRNLYDNESNTTITIDLYKSSGTPKVNNESLNEKMVRVEASEEDINDVVEILNKHGFKLDDNYKPGRGLFGSYHIQVINPDLTYIDDDKFVKAIEPLADDLDHLSTAINMPITYNFGANEDGIVTAGVDIHVGYKDDGID